MNKPLSECFLYIEITRKGYRGEEIISISKLDDGFEVYINFQSHFFQTYKEAVEYVKEQFNFFELSPLGEK